MRWFAALLTCLSLGACAVAPVPETRAIAATDTALAACCSDLERYPAWAVAALESQIDEIGEDLGYVVFRNGRLNRSDEVKAYMTRVARPLDIVLVSNKGRASGQLLPGFFSHAAIYIGSEAHLRAEGLWDLPSLRPHHDAIRAGQMFFDSTKRGVGFTPLTEVTNTDAFALLSPGLEPGEKRRLLNQLMGYVGDPFDYHFDAGDPTNLYCVELIDLTYPGIDLPHHPAYGRAVVVPDDLAAQALRGHPRLSFKTYLFRRAGWIRSGTPQMLATTIGTQWPAAR